MSKIKFTLIILLGAVLQSFAQANFSEHFLAEYNRQIQSLTVVADVWRADSTYCYALDGATGEEIAVARNYNLAFTELKGQILEERREQRIDGEWINSLYKTYEYDAEDNLVTTVDQGWMPSESAWVNSDKVLYDYNGNADNFDVITNQRWENEAWEDRFQTQNTFNPTHFKLTQSDNFIFEDGAWVKDNVFYFSVNFNSLLTEGILFQKRNEDGIISNFSRTIIKRDEMGNDTLTTVELFNEGWNFVSRVYKEFEGENEVLRTEQSYSTDTEAWFNVNQNETEYNEAGQQTQRISSNWSTADNEFVPAFRNSFTYDEAGNLQEFDTYSYNFGEWVFNGRCEIFWSEYVVEIDPTVSTQELNTTECYLANPIRSGASINCSELEFSSNPQLDIFDLQGRLVASQKITSQESIKIPALKNKGLYNLVIRNEHGILWRKKVVN